MTTKVIKGQTPPRRGRPRLGDCRIECIVPQAVMDELKKRQKAGKGYYTRVAANILCEELIGGVIARDGSLLRTSPEA